MAIVKTGNTLNPAIIQPGWKVASDGYGLITSTTTFVGDHAAPLDEFERGQPHPDVFYNFLKAHKYSISWDSLTLKTITVDYVGIDPEVNSGNRTIPNLASANGLTAENITSHPNFFSTYSPFTASIAGPAPYTQDTPNNLAPTVGTGPAYLGLNGACFERTNGGRFIGFVDPSVASLYGKTQYLATTTSYSGVVYYKNVSNVQALLLLLNTASSTASWGSEFPLLPAWAPIGTVSGVGHKNLLSQVNVEEFGSLYKVNYEIRYSKEGWNNKVYVNIAAP